MELNAFLELFKMTTKLKRCIILFCEGTSRIIKSQWEDNDSRYVIIREKSLFSLPNEQSINICFFFSIFSLFLFLFYPFLFLFCFLFFTACFFLFLSFLSFSFLFYFYCFLFRFLSFLLFTVSHQSAMLRVNNYHLRLLCISKFWSKKKKRNKIK